MGKFISNKRNMPTDWENNVIVKRPNTKTRFCSVPIGEPTSCHKYFGKYHPGGETILVCEPERGSSCVPWIVIPEGTIAVIMTSGAFACYGAPGFRAAGPFTEAKYLVSMQDFVYESPGNQVLT